MRFGREAQELARRYIPAEGPSTVLQGELLRAVEKLWFEGQDNGNINWDGDFEHFCDLLGDHLLRPGVLDPADRAMAGQSLAILRHCGRVAYRLKPSWARQDDYELLATRYPGILDEPDDPRRLPDLAYVHDDLYRHLIDCVVIHARRHPEPVPYTAPPGTRR